MSIFVDIEKDLGSFRLKVKFSAGDEVTALFGESGCGKSMTLKCIAGMEKPDRGKIVMDGVTLFDSEKHINLPPQKRHTGLLLQNYALFPNMNVLQNIRAGARREKDQKKRERMIREIVETFGLTGVLKHFPHQLSGGQQQRVALARLLVSSPGILLLDEPFSALDSHLRFRLEQEVREIIHRFKKTVILVSHDREEVFRLSDNIAIMHDGQIETYGDKWEVFQHPETRYAAVLTGCRNISRIEKLGEHRVRALDWQMEVETACEVKDEAYIGIGMRDISCEDGNNRFRCRVVDTIENPFSYTVMLRADNSFESAAIGWEMDKKTWQRMRADNITISLPPENLLLLRG